MQVTQVFHQCQVYLH